MGDTDLSPIGLGMKGMLPMGWRDAQVALFEVEQMQGIAQAQARGVVQRRGKLGIEARIRSLMLVIELTEMDQGDVGEYILDEQRLSPAGMRQDHIRAISLAPLLQQQSRYLLAMQHCVFQRAQITMRLSGRRPDGTVSEQWYAG